MANQHLKLPSNRLSGKEPLTNHGTATPYSVLDFWRWSSSDLLGNTLRGVLAEYIVATAFDVTRNSRIEWAEYDLLTQEGLKLEVKSAAYLQSWQQKALSKINFGIEPKKTPLGTNIANSTATKCRHADVYIFCLLHHRDMLTVNPLDLEQWTFYTLPTKTLDAECGKQKRLSLSRLLSLRPLVATYTELVSQVQSYASKT